MSTAGRDDAKASDPSRFQYTGGLLERSLYVERPADRALPEALLAGEYCHILAPRQIGKTSLCFRAARELSRRGVRCALVDVTAVGTPSTTEEWYFGLVDEIARRLKLPDPLDAWQRRAGVAPAQRFRDFLRGLVEDDPAGPPLVVFLDEIETVRLAPVEVDDFLLILRSFHEERGQSPALARLTFCLIGVTTPNDLIKNKSVTPFNVSKPIRVDDFTRAECDALGSGLASLDADAGALLDAVYAWTDGHPYMTMRACFELARRKSAKRGDEAATVDALVREMFLDRPLEDANLNYAARRFEDPKFERDGARLADKIQLYRTVLSGKEPAAHNESAVQMELRICGMVKDVEIAPGRRVLRPRNRIYQQALDLEWLRSKGDRRFFSEAVWKWLDAGKDEAALLRGVVLERAVEWSKTNVLSEDEQAFLDASQRHATRALTADYSRITQEVALAQTAQKEATSELAKAQDALTQALAEKRDVEAARDALAAEKRDIEATRDALQTQQTKLKASVRAWFYLALLGLFLAALVAGVLVQSARQKASERTIEAEKAAADAASARDTEQRLRAETQRLQKQNEELRTSMGPREEEARKKDAELKAKDEQLAQRADDIQKANDARARALQDLAEANKKVAEVNRYIAQNQDLKQTADELRTKLHTCESTKRLPIPPASTGKAPDDPYGP